MDKREGCGKVYRHEEHPPSSPFIRGAPYQQRTVPLPEGYASPSPPPQRVTEKGMRRVIPSTSSSPFPPPRSPSSCIRCRHRARLFLQPGIAAGTAVPPPGAAGRLEGPGGAGGSGGRCRAGPGSPPLYGRAVHAAAGPGPGGERCPPPPAHSPGPPAAQVRSPRSEGGDGKLGEEGHRNCVNMYVLDIFPPWGGSV